MEVIKVEEQADGSAILEIELDKEEVKVFLGYAIKQILIEATEGIREELKT